MSYPEIVEFLNTPQGPYLPNKDTVNQAMLIVQNRLLEVANKNKI
jgi:hypothetical protein